MNNFLFLIYLGGGFRFGLYTIIAGTIQLTLKEGDYVSGTVLRA